MYNTSIWVGPRGTGSGPVGDQIWERGSGTLSAQTKLTGCDASGDYAIAEGQLTIASGDSAHAEGILTEAAGPNSHAGGEFTLAIGIDSFVHGSNSEALAELSAAFGAGASAYLFGSQVYASGEIGTNAIGVAQRMEMILRSVSEDATPVELFLNYLITGNLVLDPLLAGYDVVIWDFHVKMLGVDTANGDTLNVNLKGTFKSINGVATILNPLIVETMEGDNGASTWDVAVAVDGGGTYLKISATGQNGKTIRWSALVTINQQAFDL